jgi:hypothetical protein
MWRTQLFRTLLPKPVAGGKFEGLQAAKQDVSRFLKEQNGEHFAQFVATAARIFLKPAEERTEESYEDIIKLMDRLSELHVQLQTQMGRISTLLTEPLVGMPFGQRWIDVHRCQTFDKNNGKVAAIALNPLVVFFGDEDGEGYTEQRLITKATVLVWKPEPSRKAAVEDEPISPIYDDMPPLPDNDSDVEGMEEDFHDPAGVEEDQQTELDLEPLEERANEVSQNSDESMMTEDPVRSTPASVSDELQDDDFVKV